MESIPLSKAAALSFVAPDIPVATKHQLGLILFRLYEKGVCQHHPLRIRKNLPSHADFSRLLKKLRHSGVLTPFPGLPSNTVFRIFGKQPTEEEVACAVDPFAYLSHLSAMAYHGFTKQIQETIIVSSPPPPKWRTLAHEKMAKDLGDRLIDYDRALLPKLTRIGMKKVGRRPVHRFSSAHHGAFKHVKNSSLRVSTIGRTFLDMIKTPDLCGGIFHVLDVYQEHAERHLNLIVSEIERRGGPIDKVRGGYILEEVCGLPDPIIESWVQFAQRGGSRKLDPGEEYRPVFSEKWCLSINAE